MHSIKIENVSKYYRLGTIGNNTLYEDLNRLWAKLRKKPDPLLKVDLNLKDEFLNKKGIWALKNINIEINQGEVFGIIGHNGAGKSTLLKILSRITTPTKGLIKLRGRIASLLEVGTGFHPDLTGRENIYLNGSILGMTRQEIDKKLDEIIDFSDVEQFIDTPVKRYSSGMHVRLAFSVAAHLEPEILIVDEVLAVGDFSFQEKCLGKLNSVSKEGRTILFVSHNLQSIWSLCPKTIWMEDGRIKEINDTSSIINKYRNYNLSRKDVSFSNISRIGTQKLKIMDLKILSENNEETSEIKSGSNFKINFKFKINKEINFEQLHPHIIIRNENFVRLIPLSNIYSGDKFKKINRNIGSLICNIHNIPLLPGVYNFIISIKLGSELLDKFESPKLLNIIENEKFHKKELPPKNYGQIHVKHSWEIK